MAAEQAFCAETPPPQKKNSSALTENDALSQDVNSGTSGNMNILQRELIFSSSGRRISPIITAMQPISSTVQLAKKSTT